MECDDYDYIYIYKIGIETFYMLFIDVCLSFRQYVYMIINAFINYLEMYAR